MEISGLLFYCRNHNGNRWLLTSRIFGLPDDADQSLLALWANERGFKLIQTRIRQQGYCSAGQVTVVALLLFEDEKWIGATENIFDILEDRQSTRLNSSH